jgi:hypothetical protein
VTVYPDYAERIIPIKLQQRLDLVRFEELDQLFLCEEDQTNVCGAAETLAVASYG